MPPRLRWAGAGSKRDSMRSALRHRGTSRAQHYIALSCWRNQHLLQTLALGVYAQGPSSKPCQGSQLVLLSRKQHLNHLNADEKPLLCCNAWWFGDDGKGSVSSGGPSGLQSISQDSEGRKELSKILKKS